ncbi:MAG: hypothetical protein QOE07_2826 [Acidimicrobiaceae bacterium]|nr:hypothetical protein [Acidimicrobiaceae bacterium]
MAFRVAPGGIGGKTGSTSTSALPILGVMSVGPRRRRVGWVIGALLLGTLVVVVLLVVMRMFAPHTLNSGRRAIRLMSTDPIVRFRAPATELRSQGLHPAQRNPFGEGESTSSIHQLFAMRGEPGDTIEAYRQAAQAGDWMLVTAGCSRVERATAAVFAKPFDGFDATLVVRAQLDQAPALSQPGPPDRRALSVSLDAAPAGVESLTVDAGLHRDDIGCLRQLDPADPDLQPPPVPTLSPAFLCSGLPVAAAQTITPQVVRVQPQAAGGAECWLTDPFGSPLFIVKQASQPPAYYKDRQLATTPVPGQILFSVYGKKDPGLARAVLVPSSVGPLVVSAGGALAGGQKSDDLLIAYAGLVSHFQPAAPSTTSTSAAVPATGDLIGYSLEGGIAGTMSVTVTRDGHATYSGGTPHPIRFDVAPATMEELTAALARVNIAELSRSYGSGSGPDFQSQVVTYQGKTVTIRSGAPAELRDVTSILSRILIEGRSRR